MNETIVGPTIVGPTIWWPSPGQGRPLSKIPRARLGEVLNCLAGQEGERDVSLYRAIEEELTLRPRLRSAAKQKGRR